jgi:hypothetical protein
MSTHASNKDDLSLSSHNTSLAIDPAEGNTTSGNTKQNTSRSGDAWSITNAHPETSQAFILSDKFGRLELSTAGMAETLRKGDIEPSRHATQIGILVHYFDKVASQHRSRKQTDRTTLQAVCKNLADLHNQTHASWIHVHDAPLGDELTVHIIVFDPRSVTPFKGDTLVRKIGSKFGGANKDTKSAGSYRWPSKA